MISQVAVDNLGLIYKIEELLRNKDAKIITVVPSYIAKTNKFETEGFQVLRYIIIYTTEVEE